MDANLSLPLGAFGSMSSVAFEKDKTDGLSTGTRLVCMHLDGVIPNRLCISGTPASSGTRDNQRGAKCARVATILWRHAPTVGFSGFAERPAMWQHAAR